jgi:hypothetical protein
MRSGYAEALLTPSTIGWLKVSLAGIVMTGLDSLNLAVVFCIFIVLDDYYKRVSYIS